ncbi:hypothetical protein CYB_0638 [Synechococcus sp. JA-2-3B'a(2-13)]|nr:hypothetical protein CYB_0638 [Synechococcus sp. JA-2-3B'a(2-13)]
MVYRILKLVEEMLELLQSYDSMTENFLRLKLLFHKLSHSVG